MRKRGKKGKGGAGRELPAAGGAVGGMDEGKGQALVVVAGGELARGDGRRGLTAAEFQGLSAVPAEGRVVCEHRQPEDEAHLPDRHP